MRRQGRNAALALLAAAMALSIQQSGWAETTQAEAEGIIFERQQIMEQLEEDAGTLGEIAAGLQPPDKLAVTARAIAQGARDSIIAFESRTPGGRTKPEAWSNWADFAQRMDSFAKHSDEMAQAAETGNLPTVISMMGDALPCKQCHDLYRERKR